MTWNDWVGSSYNVDKFYIAEEHIYSSMHEDMVVGSYASLIIVLNSLIARDDVYDSDSDKYIYILQLMD